MGLFKSKPVVINPLMEKDTYIGWSVQLATKNFAAAGFTVRSIAVKPADTFHPPNGRVDDRRITIHYDWITEKVRAIHVG